MSKATRHSNPRRRQRRKKQKLILAPRSTCKVVKSNSRCKGTPVRLNGSTKPWNFSTFLYSFKTFIASSEVDEEKIRDFKPNPMGYKFPVFYRPGPENQVCNCLPDKECKFCAGCEAQLSDSTVKTGCRWLDPWGDVSTDTSRVFTIDAPRHYCGPFDKCFGYPCIKRPIMEKRTFGNCYEKDHCKDPEHKPIVKSLFHFNDRYEYMIQMRCTGLIEYLLRDHEEMVECLVPEPVKPDVLVYQNMLLRKDHTLYIPPNLTPKLRSLNRPMYIGLSDKLPKGDYKTLMGGAKGCYHESLVGCKKCPPAYFLRMRKIFTRAKVSSVFNTLSSAVYTVGEEEYRVEHEFNHAKREWVVTSIKKYVES